MTNQKHQMNSQDMLMIHSMASNSNVGNAYKDIIAGEINAEDGIKIYIRAVKKIESLTKDVRGLFEECIQLKKHRKLNEHVQKNAEMTTKIIDAQNVINEFLKGFSVVHDEAAKDFMILFLNRFSFLSENLQLFLVNQSAKHLDENFEMISRIKQTLEKMLEISQKQEQNKDEATTEVENSEVSV